MENEVVLHMTGITKRFPGVLALDNVDFTLCRGEVHGLMGENGAGKSTLMKVLMGLYQQDGGAIELMGRNMRFANVREAMASGISMIHQELNLMPEMTVAENIFISREPLKRGFVDYRTMNQKARELLDVLELSINPTMKLKNLTVAGQQMVEIAKAVSRQANVLIMDEPTSAISDQEVERLFAIIRSLTAKGAAVIYISHRMDEIYQICDRITILRDGKLIASKSTRGFPQDQLINAMVGRTLRDYYPKEYAQKGEVVLDAENLSIEGTAIKNISFSVRAGEVVGFAGMMGSGRTETCEAIFGIRKLAKGFIRIGGKAIVIRSPSDAVSKGIAFVSEDRKQFGLFLIGSVRDNIVLSALKRINRSMFIKERALNSAADDTIKKLAIKTPNKNTKVESLSGGNQQKVVLGKWLLMNAKLLILDEPTRGIDVGAKTEVYRLINQLTQKGMAVIMVSSEMPEVLGMSDRIVVFSEGRITASLDHAEVTQETIMRYATPQKEAT